jgi:outer membrane protein assembly factor BamB
MKTDSTSLQGASRGTAILLVAVGVAGATIGAYAEDWPIYRGVNYDGISRETDWKSDWGKAGPKVLWRAAVGIGYSSIVISGGRAYTMGNGDGPKDSGKVEETDTVYCLDAVTGQLIWKHLYPCARQPLYYEGGTLATPTVDGEVVYTLSKMGDLFCLDAGTGKVKWQVQVNRDLGYELPTWSFSSSPLVVGDLLILNLGSAGVAFDKRTGKVIWENGKAVCGYATPLPGKIDGQECVVLGAAQAIIGVRIQDGQVLWRHRFVNKHKATAADPLVRGNEVFASSAYGRGCVKIKIAKGKPSLIFDNKVMRNLMSCSVLFGDQIYGFDEYDLKCIDFADSKEHWAHRGYGKGSLMMSADGRMLVMGEQGELAIVRATPKKYQLLARSQILPKGMCRTVPVLANGLIYARNARGDMVCVDVR